MSWCLAFANLKILYLPPFPTISMEEAIQKAQSSRQQRIDQLSHLLEHLPQALPSPEPSPYPFAPYSVDVDFLERYGDESSALNATLEHTFGFKSRTTGDGVVPIIERGAGICGVADVLEDHLVRDPRNMILDKWIKDITAGTKKVYAVHQV